MVKNIIFDMGNVLVPYDFELFFMRLGYQRGQRSLSEAHGIIYEFECGKMAIPEFLTRLAETYNATHFDDDYFRNAWCDVFSLDDELVNYAKKLTSDYRVIIFSNNDELHFPYIWNKYPALHFFAASDIMITSRIGYIKPEEKAYSLAAEMYNFAWEDSLFIDDVKQNLLPAQEAGALTIHHQSSAATIEKINNLLNR